MSWETDLTAYEKFQRSQGRNEAALRGTVTYLRALGKKFKKPYLEISQEELLDWISKLRKKGLRGKPLSESSIATALSRVRALLRWLNDGERPPSLKGLKIGRGGSRVKRKGDLLTEEDMERILKACSHQKRTILLLLWATGARPSEVLRLRREDISFEEEGGRQYALLAFTQTKTEKPREAPLADPEALQALMDYLALASTPEKGFIFPSPYKSKKGAPLEYQGLWLYLKRAAKEVGLSKRVYPYLFRHTKATMIYDAPPGIRDRLMGWTGGSMWKNYTHLATDDVRDWLLEQSSPSETKEVAVAELPQETRDRIIQALVESDEFRKHFEQMVREINSQVVVEQGAKED